MQVLRSTATPRALSTRPAAVCPAVVPEAVRRTARAPLTASPGRKQLSVSANALDSVGDSSLGPAAPTVRNIAWGSFWVQLPLSVVSGCILLFGASLTRAPTDISRVFTFIGIIAGFISTFFARSFLDKARAAIDDNKPVKRSALLAALVRNTNINLAGIGIVLVGLQASVGTLVSKTMLGAANAPYAQPQAGSTLISLDVFSLQASTNVMLSHFVSLVATNLIIARLASLNAKAA